MLHTIDFSDIFSSDYSSKISFKKGEIIHSYRDYEEKAPQIGAILEGTAVLEGPTNEGRWMINALIGNTRFLEWKVYSKQKQRLNLLNTVFAH